LAVTSARPIVDEAGTIVLYSHDTYGLGHLRRNLAIAYAVHEHG
jgi:predicted glycosyltransferase